MSLLLAGIFLAGACRDDHGATQANKRAAPAPSVSAPWVQRTRDWPTMFFGVDVESLPSPKDTGFRRGKTEHEKPAELLFEFSEGGISYFSGPDGPGAIGLWVDVQGEVWRFKQPKASEPRRVVDHLGHIQPHVLVRMRDLSTQVGQIPLVNQGPVCNDCAGSDIRVYRPGPVTIGSGRPDLRVDPSPGSQTLVRWVLALWRDLA